MEAQHPFRRTADKEHFPPFSDIFEEGGEEEEEEEENMSIDLVATLRGDQLDPTTTCANQHWDAREEEECSEFFRDSKRVGMLKTPLSSRRNSRDDDVIRLLRDLGKRVTRIEKTLNLGREPDEKVPRGSPRGILKSPVMRRRKYTPSASTHKQPQFGLSPIPSMLGSPARRQGRSNIARTPVAPWMMSEAPTTTTARLDFEVDEDGDENEIDDVDNTSMLEMMDLKVSKSSKMSGPSRKLSPIKRDARYWRERLGSSAIPLPDSASILRRSQSFRRSWG